MLGHQHCRVMGAILLSMGTLMANECRSNPQCRIHFLVLTLLFYLIYLPQTTSIRSIGASFGEDSGLHHAASLEADLLWTL